MGDLSHKKQSTPSATGTETDAHDHGQSTGVASQNKYGNAAVAEHICADHDDKAVSPEPSGSAAKTLDETRPVGGTVPSETRTALMTKLQKSARSTTTLNAIKAASGNLDFPLKWSSRGNYHTGGEIWLDRNGTESTWFTSMAHELVHLQTYVEGRQGDAKKLGRDAYVETMMDDEINAQAAGYITAMQTGASSSAAGYADFSKYMKKNFPTMLTPAKGAKVKWDEVEAKAKTWLKDQYKSGTWKTSNTGENYYDYWGKAWDAANPSTGGAAGG
jgi:hypothetical protein